MCCDKTEVNVVKELHKWFDKLQKEGWTVVGIIENKEVLNESGEKRPSRN